MSNLAIRVARLDPRSNIDPAGIDIELRHKHLPRLTDLDVIEYDRRSEVVVYRGDDQVESLLEPAKDLELENE